VHLKTELGNSLCGAEVVVAELSDKLYSQILVPFLAIHMITLEVDVAIVFLPKINDPEIVASKAPK
jgi:hypothetical protein